MSKTVDRDLAEWDAEIEADFQRAVAATKAAGRRKRGRRYIGFPLAFLVDVCRLVPGRSAVPIAIAVLIYRRTIVCRSRTVTLPGTELAELGIDRPQKSRALALLARVGLIRIEQKPGRTAAVTLLWSD
jgi:hypothetical protein